MEVHSSFITITILKEYDELMNKFTQAGMDTESARQEVIRIQKKYYNK